MARQMIDKPIVLDLFVPVVGKKLRFDLGLHRKHAAALRLSEHEAGPEAARAMRVSVHYARRVVAPKTDRAPS